MPERTALAPALRAVLFVWATEAMVARISCDRQAPGDLALSLGALLALGLLPALAVARLFGAAPRLRAAALGLCGAAPVAFVAIGWIFTPAALVRPFYGPLAVLIVTLTVAGWRLFAALRFDRPFSRPAGAAVLLGAALIAAWWILNGALPPLPLLGAAFAALAAAAVLAGARSLAPLALLPLTLAVALWPTRSVPVVWSADLPAARSDAPDVVLLCVDTLRADTARALSSYQRLAREGTAFPHAQAAGPWTMPSMATVMTGLPPWSHGAGSAANWTYVGLSPETPVLAERFRDAGYDTAAVVNNPVVSESFGYQRGFQVWDSASRRSLWSLPRTKKTMEARPFAAHCAAALRLAGRRAFFDAPFLARSAEDLLAQRRADRPLFLWLHFLDCHFPYRRAAGLDGVSWPRRMELERGDAHRYRADPWWSGEEGRAALQAAYAREIAEVDAALERVLDALGPPPARGRIVVLFSDHGEEFFEHGGIEHGHALWQELLAVPLVIAGLSGRAPGVAEAELVAHADLAPTLLAAAGIAVPAPAQAADRMPGRDLARAPLAPAPAVSENFLRSSAPWDSEWAVRIGDLKAILGPAGAARVFDLAADPAERQDLAALHADFLRALVPRSPRVPRVVATGGAGARRALMGVGYVGR